jgi:hypothetical protein
MAIGLEKILSGYDEEGGSPLLSPVEKTVLIQGCIDFISGYSFMKNHSDLEYNAFYQHLKKIDLDDINDKSPIGLAKAIVAYYKTAKK